MFTIDETPVILVAVFGKVVCPICQNKMKTNEIYDCINVAGLTIWIIVDV